MKISFTMGAGQDVRVNNIGCRVLTENLTRNPNFDVTFLNYTITSSFMTQKVIRSFVEKMMPKHSIMGECATTWFNMFRVTYGNYHHVDLLLDELKTDVLFYSCSLTMFEFYSIAQLLNAGIKLVIGGPLLETFSFEEIRNILSETVEEKYMKNLLIIKGYVDLTTDIYAIVKKWEDYQITENDFSTFWECKEDYTVDKIQTMKRFGKHMDLSFLKNFYPENYSVFILDNRCWWGKCRFCIYPFFKPIYFTGGSSIEKVANNIIETAHRHGNRYIFFANDYFRFTEDYTKILDILVKNGIKIVIFSGIQSLLDKKYIDNVNKYVSAIKLGMESFSDFSLNYVNKGYTYDDVKKAKEVLIKDVNNDIFILGNIIIDLPVKNRQDAIQNYERAWNFKRDIRDAGFDFNFSSKLLTIGKETIEQFCDGKSMMLNETEKNISGRYLLFKYFRETGISKDDIYKKMSYPLLRIDDKGKELPTDFDMIDYDLAKKVFRWI